MILKDLLLFRFQLNKNSLLNIKVHQQYEKPPQKQRYVSKLTQCKERQPDSRYLSLLVAYKVNVDQVS